MRLIKYLFLIPLIVSCKKDPKPVTEAVPLHNGVLVLCEGLFQQNNAGLSWIDLSSSSINNQFFTDRTQRELGDTGNDMQRYGGKLYVLTTVSSTLEVLDAKDASPIKQISMMNGSVAKQPRFMAFNGSKVYISCFDGYVDVLDTTTLSILQRIQVGANPEGLAVANGKLYVANSGGLNYPDMDSTLSVIDLQTGSEISKITVGLNPGGVMADQEGDVYVISRGNYGSIPFKFVRVDTQLDEKVEEFTFQVSAVAKMGNDFLVAWQDPSSSQNSLGLFDPSSESMINASYIPMDAVSTLYGVSYNGFDGRIYVCDAGNYSSSGFVRVYSTSGVLQTSYQVGLIPSKLLFYE